MPRGQKTCDSCKSLNGPRAKRCKECGNNFVFKVKSKEQKTTKIIKTDWRELQKGDKIKVRGGPYFEKDGQITPMGYRGHFIVDSLDDSGICAFGMDSHSGFCHIYMGSDQRNPETGIWKVRHKLKRIVKKS